MGCIRVPITAITTVIEAKMHPPLLSCAYFRQTSACGSSSTAGSFCVPPSSARTEGHCNEE
nr:MAG TPA: hypothetical protein [Caudoviricetes sp.]